MGVSDFIPMKITITLEHREVLIANNPFDGVLARIYFDKQKSDSIFNGDYSQKMDFLKMSDGIYHTSNPVYNINFLSNEFLIKNFDNKLFEKIGDKPFVGTLYNKQSGKYKSWMESYVKKNVDEVVYYTNGDFDVICSLLEDLRYLGKKASLGYGKVSKVRVEEINEDMSLVYNNKAMRPLPAIEKYSGLDDKSKALYNLTHPYWERGNEEICIMPERRVYA